MYSIYGWPIVRIRACSSTVDPVEMTEKHAEQKADQAGPIGHRQAQPNMVKKVPAVGRMADQAIRAVLHHLLVRRHDNIAGKEAAQRPDRIPAQSDAQENDKLRRAERMRCAARERPRPGTTRRGKNSGPCRPIATQSGRTKTRDPGCRPAFPGDLAIWRNMPIISGTNQTRQAARKCPGSSRVGINEGKQSCSS